MPSGVRCLVEECVFHDEQDGCTATAIEVRTNGNDIVGTPKGTLCRTFQYKDAAHSATAGVGSHGAHS